MAERLFTTTIKTSRPARILKRAESTINYEFLDATKLNLPKGFDAARGVVTWEGAIASEFTGEHCFRFTYAGYLKVWLGDQLVLDRWRQAWNPGSALIPVYLEKDRAATR